MSKKNNSIKNFNIKYCALCSYIDFNLYTAVIMCINILYFEQKLVQNIINYY